MIKLDNVSKFYYSQGVIGVGFSKVSLNFDVGEFVAITGESGSGKSTLLNVISGLDSYEEGEMYVNGEETSHYTEKDFEDYRRKYIGNIFQNFNLINSYTVYQNIELVMLLNGSKRSEVKARVNELIDKVGLKEYKNTKAAKLSGGQKQRVAIARALAKDTPIIIADEPTGNLDSESATDIIELLASIAKDKLVVIVTHNYDQVEPYVTRKIKMHDGKVLEDSTFDREDRNANISEEEIAVSYKNIRPLSEIRLGVRNAFNIPVKFLLCTFVFLFVSIALICELAIFQREIYESDISGWNSYFNVTSDERIILKKIDSDGKAQAFTKDDIENIKNTSNIKEIFEQDILLDIVAPINASDGSYSFYGKIASIDGYPYGDVTYGRMPKNANEIVLVTTKNSYYLPENENQISEVLEKDYYRNNTITWDIKKDKVFKIVGIKIAEAQDNALLTSGECIVYYDNSILEEVQTETNQKYSNIKMEFAGKTYTEDSMYPMFYVRTSDKIEEGTCWVSDDYNYLVKNGYCIGETLKMHITNTYYEKDLELKVSNIYYKSSFLSAYTLPDGYTYEELKGTILINPKDLAKLYDEPSYQISVFVEDAQKVNDTANELSKMGFEPFVMKDSLYQVGSTAIMNLITKAVTFGLAVVLLIISYFVVRIILKSRNFYYSTIRMLGANESTARALILIDLFVDANIAYFLSLLGVFALTKATNGVFIVEAISTFMAAPEFVAIYVIVILISLFVGFRYSNRLFKKSTIQTIKEEV